MEGMDVLQFHTFLYSALEEVSAEFEVPGALPWEQSRLNCWIVCSEGLWARLETLEKAEFLAPTDIRSTIARLLYYTNWATRSNTYAPTDIQRKIARLLYYTNWDTRSNTYAPTDIQRTIARLLYYTNWATHSNAYAPTDIQRMSAR